MNHDGTVQPFASAPLLDMRRVILAVLLLVPLGLAAQPNSADTFRILPIFDALTGSFPTDQFVAEANRLKAQVGQNRANFKVGFSFIYPGLADTRRYCQIAQTNNIALGVILAQQTHSLSSTIANIARTDFRDYAWRLDGVTWEGAVGTNGSPLYPDRDYRTVTPSRYCAGLRDSYESTVRTQAREIVSLLQEFPGVLAVVNACIEEELATGGAASDNYLADYSPFAVTEFRDWLRHTGKYDDLTGPYAGQGAPEAIVGTFVLLAGTRRSPFYDDPDPANAHGTGQSFNARFGTSFTTWALRYWDLEAFPASITSTNFDPSPASGLGFTAGGFDPPRVRNPGNAYWRAWSWDYQDQGSVFPPGNPSQPAFGFRQVLVKNFVNDLLGWCASEGVPAELLYAHQIPTEQVGASRNRSSASPVWTGLLSLNQQLGITRFGSLDAAQLQQYSSNWGIFEWHPAPFNAPSNAVLYTATLAQLDNCYRNGARVLFPGWWRQAGTPVDPTFPLPDSLFAQGLHDWLAARPDGPLPRLGTNAPPIVSLVAPSSGATITTNTLSLTAYAAVADGSVARVEFFANGVRVGQVDAPPYVFVWTNVPLGTHQLTAHATDRNGGSAHSLPVLITVTAPDANLISPGAVWKYNDTGANLGTAWRATNYNDSAWRSGAGELGYGDLPEGRPETTVLCCSNAASKFITYYFRRTFTLADPARFTSLSARLLRDDGAVVYLNGLEVWRSNMPTGAVSYLTLAASAVTGTDENTYFTTLLSPSLLRAGTNLVAIEVHQSASTSSDLSFDFALTGQLGNPAPAQLALSRAGTNLILAWPFGVPIVQLFETPELTPPVVWSPVGTAPLLSDGRWVQSVLISTNSQRFFMLRAP